MKTEKIKTEKTKAEKEKEIFKAALKTMEMDLIEKMALAGL
jgi:hypothetical protein